MGEATKIEPQCFMCAGPLVKEHELRGGICDQCAEGLLMKAAECPDMERDGPSYAS